MDITLDKISLDHFYEKQRLKALLSLFMSEQFAKLGYNLDKRVSVFELYIKPDLWKEN